MGNTKHRYGQYFTISPIADFMVKLISHPKTSKVLEPSCGKGVFLDSLHKSGFTDLSAYEIDPSLKTNHDFVKYQSFLDAPVSDKYDVVIGNPPYIRWKNLEPELKEELEYDILWNKYFNSLCDYLFIFILKSIEHLNEGGELIFICTDYWLNTTHSASLRNYMCEHGYFSEIYHFKEAPLFEKVTASFIIFRFIKHTNSSSSVKKDITLYRYNKTGVPTSQELESLSCFTVESIPQFMPFKRWIMANEETQNELEQFENHCVKAQLIFDAELNRIGDICDIGNGMVSGLDAAFKITDTKDLNDNERKHLITVFKAKDLRPYRNASQNNYIFIQEDITPETFAQEYPNFAKHFTPYIKQLSDRYSYNRYIPYWEFVFPRNQQLFERNENRIFVPCKERISNKDYFRFCFAPANVYPTQDVTAIFRKSDTKESLEYILAYLNNRRVFDWLRFNGIMKGEIVEFSETPISQIPFRKINWSDPKETKLHDAITSDVKQFLSTGDNIYINNIIYSFNQLFK